MLLGGAAALGAGAYGLSQGAPASNVNIPQVPNTTGAANAAYSGIGGLSAFNLSDPRLATNITRGLVHSPYAGQYQGAAGQAGQLGQLQALGQYGVGQDITGMGMNQLAPYAGQVMNTAMDPQQALYQRTLQQVMDQTGAANAMAGVGTTPYGAGLQGQALSNFNIDWQNQQLQRQIAGLGAGGAALGQAGGLAQLGQGMAAAAPGQYLQSAGLPYGVQQQIGQGQMGALGGLQQYGVGGAQIPQQQIQDYLNYIGAGQGSAGLGLNQSQLAFNQNAAYARAMMGGLGGIGAMGYGIGGSQGFNTPFFQSGWGMP